MPTGDQGQAGPPAAPGGGGPGLLANPALLAAGAAGCMAAFCVLWAFRGLPLGAALFWATPLPLFLAGLGFGTASAIVAATLATLLVALTASGFGTLIFLLLFAIPVPVLVACALRTGPPRMVLSLPLALLGLGPLAALLLAVLWLAGDGGLEAAMRRAVEAVLARLGLPVEEAVVGMVVRFKAAAFGLIATASLAVNAVTAQRLLARRNLAMAAVPPFVTLRLPPWYPVLPALAAAALLAAPAGQDSIALSALLLLLLPAFYLGIAGVHARASGRRGQWPMLGLFYVLLLVFLQLMAPAMVALGLFDHFRRRPGGAAPTPT
jgi:hypothetical protein